MGSYTIFQMLENPRRGRQAGNFTTNVSKILDLKSSSEQIFIRKLSLGAPGFQVHVGGIHTPYKQHPLIYRSCVKPSHINTKCSITIACEHLYQVFNIYIVALNVMLKNPCRFAVAKEQFVHQFRYFLGALKATFDKVSSVFN